MLDDMRIAGDMRKKITTAAKARAVRAAYFEPQRKEPSDEVAEVIDADEQQLIGDGARLRWDRRRQLVVGIRFDGEGEDEWG